ncbi:MAG TPA: DUF3107 domain-containing protein [Acidimicrobiia bacterium]|jgi:hypothetical protein|nr:DUF3107 domain-containing protein [Acidimicrobiia bacterium]
MEVRIGVVYTTRELTVETDDSVDVITQAIDSALSGGDSMFWLTDTKGRRVGVPTDKIAYVEVAADAGGRKVGFGAS